MRLDDVFKTAQESRNLSIGFEAELERFSRPFKSVQMEGAFSQRLAGDRAAIDAAASDTALPLNQRHALTDLRALDRRFLAGWTGTDHDNIECNGRTHKLSAFTTAST